MPDNTSMMIIVVLLVVACCCSVFLLAGGWWFFVKDDTEEKTPISISTSSSSQVVAYKNPTSMKSSQNLSSSAFGGVPTDQAKNEYCEARKNYFKTLYNNDTSWKEMCPTTGSCEVSGDKCVVRPPYVASFADGLSDKVTRYQDDSLTLYDKYVTDYNNIKASIQSYKASNIGKENTTEYQRVLDIEKFLDNTYTIRTTRTSDYTFQQNAIYCQNTYPNTSNDSTPCGNDPRCKVTTFSMGNELVDRCQPL